MKQRLIAFAIIATLTLIALLASEHSAPNAALPLVSADYQRCLTINPGPLKEPPPRINGDNRERGIA